MSCKCKTLWTLSNKWQSETGRHRRETRDSCINPNTLISLFLEMRWSHCPWCGSGVWEYHCCHSWVSLVNMGLMHPWASVTSSTVTETGLCSLLEEWFYHLVWAFPAWSSLPATLSSSSDWSNHRLLRAERYLRLEFIIISLLHKLIVEKGNNFHHSALDHVLSYLHSSNLCRGVDWAFPGWTHRICYHLHLVLAHLHNQCLRLHHLLRQLQVWIK